jgi:hypothetical protein
MLLDSMVKVLAPIRLKDSVRLFLMESMAVRMPTRAIIPKAIIKMVRMVLSKFVRMDFKAILTFSKNMVIFMGSLLKYGIKV